MQVINRKNLKETVSFDKITSRLESLCKDLEHVDPILVAQETISALYDGISTREIDNLSADVSASKSCLFPDYNKLGGRILASNISKETCSNDFDVVSELYGAGIISPDFYFFTQKYKDDIQLFFDYSRDFLFDYFAMKTLEKAYLLKIDGKIVERPQHLWMRVSIQLHGFVVGHIDDKLSLIRETYDSLSNLYFTHATPTLFNAGTLSNQLSSCYLLGTEDNIEDIFKSIGDMAKMSKWSGGIGLCLSNIRSCGSKIKGTNGKSDGIIPLCKTIESLSRYINQSGKRKGSIAIYLEPWHADVFQFVELRKNTGDENMRARDLYLAMWIPDLFMRRVQENGQWSLMCPNECPGLVETYGETFETLYISYERTGKFRKSVKAKELWDAILESQVETGMPYISYKDNVNRRNMQSHLGVIRNSNLCNEISLYSDSKNHAVCTLASICLPKFIENGKFNFEKLQKIAGIITRNLNNIIDVNFYPTPEAKKTNIENRPLGIGVQGLADVFCMMGFPFGSPEAKELNKVIFENIYYGAVSMSIDLARLNGAYPTYWGSPHSQGLLQFSFCPKATFTLNWEPVIANMKKYGMRNSLLTAVMPTASTSQIMGNNECIEAFTTNFYVRKTMSGEFTMVNAHLVKDLLIRGLWSKNIHEEIIHDNGSIQKIEKIPQNIRDIYKTSFEIKMKDVLDQAIDRSPFIDHQQSMNLYLNPINLNALNSAHFYSWKNGLKTGIYYLHTMPAQDATKFGLESEAVQRISSERSTFPVKSQACPRDPVLRAACDACSG